MGFETSMPKPEKDDSEIFITTPGIGEIRVPESHAEYGPERLRRDIAIEHNRRTREILADPQKKSIDDQIAILQNDIAEIDEHPLDQKNDAIFKKDAEVAIASLERAKGLLLEKAA